MSFWRKAIPWAIGGIPYGIYLHIKNKNKKESLSKYNNDDRNCSEINSRNIFQCYYCRNNISPISNFCPHCGKQIVKNICSNCQELFFNGDDYCHNCNTKVDYRRKEKFELSNAQLFVGGIIGADPGLIVKMCPICGIFQDPNNIFCVSCGLDIHLVPTEFNNFPPAVTLKYNTKENYEELARHWGI